MTVNRNPSVRPLEAARLCCWIPAQSHDWYRSSRARVWSPVRLRDVPLRIYYGPVRTMWVGKRGVRFGLPVNREQLGRWGAEPRITSTSGLSQRVRYQPAP